ncbi:related to cell wall glucanase (Scw4) [Ramularia collo-cygni]|uniref:Related to cell wall glucanase (Scw4) n=1 Tax=Ramularia collo-cygni TaxID=112498 RepID=A0A2D3V7Z2_9PEZI|nr:related to cell wall glucanase (Scw4) [Ramularia collo-cygni]CZT18694.1 related to cell wall glucanase (Scw4) [Ramularia collo-cygni]
MKAGLFTIAALAASATAQVHRAHRNLHKKRDVVTAYEYATVTAPQVVVYVDGNGNPVSTGTPGGAAPTAYQAPAPAKSESPIPAAYSAPPKYNPSPAKNSPAPPAYSPAKSSAAPRPAPYASGLGMVYTPYTDAGGCKDASQVNADFEKLDGYNLFRIYGTDCNQVENVLSAAKAKKAKVFAGVFNIAEVEKEIAIIVEAAKNDWSSIDTVSIGNELVNQGTPADKVVAAIGTARTLLKAAGYTGNVVTVDTFVAMIANPSICEASDYAAANCHAFFDGGRTAEQAGDFVLEQSKRVADACGGKRVVITESGWPWQGNANGAAVPSKENQQAAIASLKSSFSKDLILFTAFDDLWKKDTADTHGCEKYYGILGH